MLNYEWDENKRLLNIEKHNIDFIDAVEAFDDPNRIERQDKRKDYSEYRYQTIGRIIIKNDAFIILIVWSPRMNGKRVISARIAHSKERKIYYEKQNELE